MASIIAATVWVVVFSLLLTSLGVVSRSIEAINISREALSDFQNKTLSDDDKEAAFQGYAKRLFVLFFLITAGSIAAFALPGIILWLLAKASLFSFEALISTATSWQFLIAATVVVMVILIISAQRKS